MKTAGAYNRSSLSKNKGPEVSGPCRTSMPILPVEGSCAVVLGHDAFGAVGQGFGLREEL
jgi:hypothetical protein